MRVQKAGLPGVYCSSHDFLPSGWIAGYLIQCYVYMSVHTIQRSLCASQACVWLGVLFQPCTADPSTTMAKQKAGLILSRVSANLRNAHRPKGQNPGLGPSKARGKKGKEAKECSQKGGGRDFLRLSCFFSVILAFSWLPLGVKIGPIARLPGKGGLKGRRCLNCLNIDGLNFLEIPQVLSLHVGQIALSCI